MNNTNCYDIDYDLLMKFNSQYLKDADQAKLPIYSINNRNQSLPIIIDYGSNTFKAGWGNSITPDLVFRALTNRSKDIKQQLQLSVIGTAGRDIDIFKGNYQSPFERNLLYHTGSFEHLNDYIFNELMVGGDSSVQHQLILTEACANSEQTRAVMIELLFECYGVPGMMIGVDSLWGSYAHGSLNKYLSQTQLIISIGDQTIHIIPIVNGQVQYNNIKRINVGGQQSLQLIYKNLQYRYNNLKQYLSFSLIEKIHRNLTYTAINYKEQLQYFIKGQNIICSYGYKDRITQNNKQYIDPQYYEQFRKTISIDFSVFKQNVQQMVDEDEIRRKKEIRMKQSERLKEALAKKKQEKEAILKIKLSEYEILYEKYKKDPNALKVDIENQFGPKGSDELKKRIKILKVKLGILPKEALDEDKYQYVDVPDTQLTPEQLTQKRYQVMMKQAIISKAIKKEQDRRIKDEIRQFRQEQPELYLQSLYDKRSNLIKKINDRKKRQQELTTRNSRFNQRRMQTLAYLGQQDNLGKDDNFGVKDEDWDIYRGITKELDSEDENAEFKLQELDLKLKDMDPDFEQKILNFISNPHQLNMELYEIQLSVDQVKCNEIYFQPSLVGVDQCGIIDAVLLSLKSFSVDHQRSLLQNIFLIGGAAQTKGLSERIMNDLRQEFDSSFNVNVNLAQDCIFDTWHGMQQFYSQNSNLINQYMINKDEYYEHGVFSQNLFKVHPFSNVIE